MTHNIEGQKRWLALIVLCMGVLMIVLDTTIVNVALPSIAADLGFSETALVWVVNAYMLTFGGFLLLGGRLADLMGRRRMFMSGLILFSLASLLGGLAQSEAWLIAARAVQGLGAGGLSALVQVILAAMISPRERGRYSGYTGATFAVATVGGPLLGGVITDTSWLGWRYCLFVGIPFALIALIVLQKTLHLPVVKRKVKVDWLGAFFITAGASLLLLWVTFANDKYEWLSWQTYVMVGGTILLALAFVFTETKASETIIPLRLFRNRTISLASLASLFVGVGMYSFMLIAPQLLQFPEATGFGLGQSMLAAGLWIAPGGIMMMLISPLGGMLINSRGPKLTLLAGALVIAVGYAVALPLMGTAAGIMIAGIVINSGVALAYGAMPALIMSSVPLSETAAANGFNSLMRSLGTTIGSAVIGVVLAHMTIDLGGYTIASKDGFRTGLLIGCGVALLSAAVAAFIPALRPAGGEDAAQQPVAGADQAPARG
jgi:EmrB/QacA subfamily drug resistance transporter